MPKIPLVTWIANAAAALTASYGDVTLQAEVAGCSRQTIYDHAHKIQHALEDAHDGGPTRAALIAEKQRLARENAQLWRWLGETGPTPQRYQNSHRILTLLLLSSSWIITRICKTDRSLAVG